MEQVLHLFITNKCRYDCEFCCNKFYKISEIPVVTVELLESVQTVCLTGGDPFSVNPNVLSEFVRQLRTQYKNINRLYAYTSGKECEEHFSGVYNLPDGINFTPKSFDDWVAILNLVRQRTMFFRGTRSNRLYVLPEQRGVYESVKSSFPKDEDFKLLKIDRIWDTTFNTPENEHFARLPILF